MASHVVSTHFLEEYRWLALFAVLVRRYTPMLNQQSIDNAIAQPGEQAANGCPALCARWNTVLNSNGQLENTPVVTSPLIPGDTITQCPNQCDPKCCSPAGQAFSQADQSQTSEGLQDDQNHPPACMDGCPKACYPACRPGCCNAPRMMSMYRQSMVQQIPMMQPMVQPFVSQTALQNRETIPRPALLSYASQGMNEAAQWRSTIPEAAYGASQITPLRSSIPYPSEDYSYPKSGMISQTRATIPQPVTTQVAGQLAQQRTKVPQTTSSVHAKTCPIPCSPMCAPNCTKHCCESYD